MRSIEAYDLVVSMEIADSIRHCLVTDGLPHRWDHRYQEADDVGKRVGSPDAPRILMVTAIHIAAIIQSDDVEDDMARV